MRGASTLAETWFQAITITPGSSRKSRRFIGSTRGHGFHRGRDHCLRCWRRGRGERPTARLNFAHAEVLQVQHGQVALFRDALEPLPLKAVGPSRDVHAWLFPMCVAALPMTRVSWI